MAFRRSRRGRFSRRSFRGRGRFVSRRRVSSRGRRRVFVIGQRM